MSHSLLIAFVLFATVMFFTPGPNNIIHTIGRLSMKRRNFAPSRAWSISSA